MMIRKVPRVSEDMPLYDILNEFQKGHSHIAVVYKALNETKEFTKKMNEATQNMVADRTAGNENKKSPAAAPAFKKRHKGCSFCILDLENTPIPEFPPNEVVVGVISMEDVIEELLQEEILDETDEYVNIHNRIKVNMHATQEEDSENLEQSSPTSTHQ